MVTTTVSIITITQRKRFQSLLILKDLIKLQTYKHIMEWVLVEGSLNEKDAEENKKNIETLKPLIDIPIRYIPYEFGSKLGALRNRGNNACKGDITVCMDDDDYYFPERIEHAVKKLTSSSCKIAGCSAILIYDFVLNRTYKFRGFHANHSTNNAMAWKKEFIKNHQHDPEKEMAEEASFTKTFTEPMVQLESEKSVIICSHNGNTFNKRELLITGTLKMNQSLDELSLPQNLIPSDILSKYQEYYKDCIQVFHSPYDIVYYTGGLCIQWSPLDQSLGGSEQAICHLSKQWVKMGKKVAVYANMEEKKLEWNGVDFYNWKEFPFNAIFPVLILWRSCGILCSMPFGIKAKKIIFDPHDPFALPYKNLYEGARQSMSKIIFKSDFHRTMYEKVYSCKISPEKYTIIPNGIRVPSFEVNIHKAQRQKYRFCYCSCYKRGLIPLLKYLWPVLFKAEPRAELHVYYGMKALKEEEKKLISGLLAQPGVMDHDRQPMNMIIREKYLSNFQLYITDSTQEIDCISIRESLVTGCIPLLSNEQLYKDRDGLHFDLGDKKEEGYGKVAKEILKLLKKPDREIEEIREGLKKSATITTWEETARCWLENI